MQSSTALYLPRLDHLRFTAAMLVFTWHAVHVGSAIPMTSAPMIPLSIFEEGHTGVSFFLTLSGFILAALCTGRRVLYGAFIRNRVLRIAPLLVVWTLLYFYTGAIAPERLFVMFFGLLVNTAAQFPGPGWTVIIEFQFYLLLPFLLVFVERHGLRYLFGLIGVAIMLRTLFYFRSDDVLYLAYHTAFGRVDQFALGIVAFHVHRSGKVPRNPLVLVFVVAVWLLLYHQFNRFGGYYHLPYRQVWIFLPTLEGVFYSLITVTYLSAAIRIPAVLDRTAAWLGTISYSLYLNHWELVLVCGRWAGNLGLTPDTPQSVLLLAFAIELPLLIAMSAATYYVIERPFLSLRRSYLAPEVAATDEPIRRAG
jgi:peptidoglycan/LPS O-acetylase OafA/YrhL